MEARLCPPLLLQATRPHCAVTGACNSPEPTAARRQRRGAPAADVTGLTRDGRARLPRGGANSYRAVRHGDVTVTLPAGSVSPRARTLASARSRSLSHLSQSAPDRPPGRPESGKRRSHPASARSRSLAHPLPAYLTARIPDRAVSTHAYPFSVSSSAAGQPGGARSHGAVGT